MTRQLWIAATLSICLAGIGASTSAQILGEPSSGGPPSVSGSGAATIERQAETLRMNVELLSKGKDLKDALAKLAERRKAAEEQLKKLGADAKSIKFGEPQISAAQNNPQIQMMMQQRMMMRQQQRGGRRAAAKPAVAPPVTVTLPLVAGWAIKADSPEQLLLASHALEEKIKAADLAGRTAAEELSPEEAELAEEAEEDESMTYMNGQEAPKPGEPRFVYVSQISAADRDKAYAEAFERAKASADRLAKAASAELGALQHLSGGGASDADSDGFDEWSGYQYQMIRRMQRTTSTADGELEAIGPRPGVLKFQVHVMASFALK